MGTAADGLQDEGMDATTSTHPQPEGDVAPDGGQEPERSRPPLERSASHRVVTGVCGGLGRRLNIDPLVFRVVIAVLCLWGGVGLFIYGVAWLMIPMEGTGKNELQRLMSGRVDGQSLGAVLVTVLGTGIFFSYMGAKDHVFPLLLIAALAFAALRYDPQRHQLPPRDPESPVAQEPPPAAPNWWQRPDPLLKTAAPAVPADEVPGRLSSDPLPTGTVPADRPSPGEATGFAEGPPTDIPLTDSLPWDTSSEASTASMSSASNTLGTPTWAYPGQSAATPPTDPRTQAQSADPRRVRGPWGLLTLLLAAGAAAVVYGVGRAHHEVNALAVLASALVVVALGLVASGFLRRQAIGLTVVGVLLSLATVTVGAAPWQHWSHTAWAPVSATQLQTGYALRFGDATLDLTQVRPTAGQTVSSHVSLGAGTLQVLLPGDGADSPEVKISAQTGAGELRLPDGARVSGVADSRTIDLNQAGAAAHGTIQLDLQIGVGQLEVVR
ncbi:PspC domain-containing protein [Streptacidiphilus anmyonensis]|uniref:PspC domain-containing protein n=1 Tax=Streptacidiphilus anmyonensis TaxID=405782 RepID=UPI0005A9332B|nr:PspC domain-containing protein [Streptacidiphilus anmyonensis]